MSWHSIDYNGVSKGNFFRDFYLEEMILKDSAGDDKSLKREKRLYFLQYCNDNEIIQHYFTIFTNYLNGGGSVPH